MSYPAHMSTRITQVDAFTSQTFTGNPAGVCILKKFPAEDWMRNVAREMNVSETAFLAPEGDGYRLRWFTPAVEVDLCGHATLASAHVLWEDGHLPVGAQARFYTRSGPLTADRDGDWIEMNFPAKPPVAAEPPAGLVRALGIRVRAVTRNEFDYLIEAESQEAVRTAEPDFSALKKMEARGIIVTARSGEPGFDFVSRFFAPAVGIDEDPVTGSAHCALAPYWSALLDRTEMAGRQVSARGGVVRVRLQGDRVILAGQAVTVMTCELRA